MTVTGMGFPDGWTFGAYYLGGRCLGRVERHYAGYVAYAIESATRWVWLAGGLPQAEAMRRVEEYWKQKQI